MEFFTKKRITLFVIGFLALIFSSSGCSKFNSIDQAEESTNNAWGEVENQYQRRMDLIPNLVNVVKGYVGHENSTLIGVIEARSKATSITIDPSNCTKEQLLEFSQVQEGLSGALSKLMMVTESYPDLKASEQFTNLQAEIAGTENRITVARKKFNSSVKGYNSNLRGISGRIWGKSVFGFELREYFKSQKGADKAPDVKF